MKNKLIWLIIIAVLAYANKDGFWGKKNEPASPAGQAQQPSNQEGENGSESLQPEEGKTLRGVLRASNDKKRGNLMLELDDSDRVIYLTSSRDFSSLYDQEVELTIDGDLNGFTLLDIKAAE